MSYVNFLYVAGSVAAGLIIGFFIIKQRKFDEKKIAAKSEKLIADTKQQSVTLVEKARQYIIERKQIFENEEKQFSQQFDKTEKLLESKRALCDKKEAKNTDSARAIKENQKAAEDLRAQVAGFEQRIDDKLLLITGLQKAGIRHQLLVAYEHKMAADAEARMQRNIEWTQECAAKDGKNMISEAIYRYASSTSAESDHAAVIVPKDEVKGRIVGRGGRMIAFFEELFGVDVVFNDEPNTILVGCFNLVQREVAKVAMDRLAREKIINEEIIRRSKVLAEQDVDKLLMREGENALKILDLENMPKDFVKLVGRLKFRTSYGQNIMNHCFEVGYFARLLANEVGADSRIAWLGGFFHDIGKAIDQEVGGSHDVLSKEILEKYNFSPEIIHAAWTHHNAAPIETIEARLVQAADAISASRPGARAESLERYLAKIKDLQDTALSFAGVKKAYAINAGREVRVVVEPEKIDDAGVVSLASDIARTVEEKGGYPGKIKVTTMRITKVTDYAK